MAFTQYSIGETGRITVTTLGGAAQYGNYDNVQLLIDKDADISETNEEGCSALYIAAASGHKEICQLLLDNGANVEQTDIDNISPLWTASRRGHYDVVKLLLEYNANPFHISDGGFTPLEAAEHEGHMDVVELLKNVDSQKGAKILPKIENRHTHTNFAQQEDVILLDGDKYINESTKYWQNKQYDECFKYTEKAIEAGLSEPYLTLAYSSLGWICLHHRKDLVSAVNYYLKCLEITKRADDAAWESACRLQWIYSELGRTEEAKALNSVISSARIGGNTHTIELEDEVRMIANSFLKSNSKHKNSLELKKENGIKNTNDQKKWWKFWY